MEFPGYTAFIFSAFYYWFSFFFFFLHIASTNMLSPTCTQQSHFLHPSSWKNEQWESRGWIKASLFPLVAGGDEEYIYMNKVTVNKQQGDQEKQDKGREFKIAGCLMPNRVVKVRVATRAFLSWDQWWSLDSSESWSSWWCGRTAIFITFLWKSWSLPTLKLFLEVALWRALFWD